MSRCKKYIPEFKAEVVEPVRSSPWSARQIVLGISLGPAL